MPEESDRFTAEKEDFRMRYQICIDDIKYVKTRQWAITYYLLLLYVAIVYISYILGTENGIVKGFNFIYASYLVDFSRLFS